MRRIRTLTAAAVAALVLALPAAVPTAASASPVGHPKGREVLAWSRFDDLRFDTARIVLGRADGSGVHAVSHPQIGEQDIDPKISPDGRTIVFERDDQQGFASLVLVGTDGRGERPLDTRCTFPCVGVEAAAWTPDGRHIAYGRVVGPIDPVTGNAVSELLYVTGLDGGRQVRLSAPGVEARYGETRPSFAPGGYLVFLRNRNADDHIAVFRSDLDGRHARRLTPWSIYADGPTVSPATTGPTRDLVVFETYGHGNPDGVASAVVTVPATCTTPADCARKTRYLTSPSALPEQNFNPAWSLDGRRVLYCRFSYVDPGPVVGDIWSMRYDGRQKTALSTDPRFEFRPTAGRVPEQW